MMLHRSNQSILHTFLRIVSGFYNRYTNSLYDFFMHTHTFFYVFFRAKQLSFSSRLLPIFSLITCMTQQPWHDTPTKSYHTSQTIFSTNDIISPPGNNFQFGCINTHSYLCKRQFGPTITSP